MGKRSESKEYGIYIPPPVCRDPRLSLAGRFVYGQVTQLSNKRGYCTASNTFLADQCGLNRDTVSAAIGKLKDLGLIRVESDGTGRRIFPCSPAGDGDIPPQESALDGCGVGAESGGSTAESGLTGAESDRGHLKLKGNGKGKKKEESSSSVLESGGELSGLSHASGIPDYDFQRARTIVAEWGAQVCLRLTRRTWEQKKTGGTSKTWNLDIPSLAVPSKKEVDKLITLALEFWPGSDPLLAFRQLLRACAWTTKGCETLQQYAYLTADGALTLRALLRLGGKEDPLTFARESVGAVPAPPQPTGSGDEGTAKLLERLSYSTNGNWTYEAYQPCWMEASARLAAMPVVPAQFYMGYVVDAYEEAGKVGVLPWLADSVTPEQIHSFAGKYADDRRNAWSGGPCLPHRDPRNGGGDFYNHRCMGYWVALAAAKGRTEFRSKSCLLCAATELAILPELAQNLSWDGSAQELVEVLRVLASLTDCDEAPHRGIDCGIKDCSRPSFIRCLHGNVEGHWHYSDLTRDSPRTVAE